MGHNKRINTYAKNPDYRGAGRRPQGSCFAGGRRAAEPWLPGGCSAGGSSSATLAPEPCAVPGGGAAARPGNRVEAGPAHPAPGLRTLTLSTISLMVAASDSK